MRFARLIQIRAESSTERNLLRNAMDMIHDLGDPELKEIDAEFTSQRDAMSRIGTGVLTLHVTSAPHLAVGLEMLRDWALEAIEDGEVPTDSMEFPTLNAMFLALKAELATYGVTLA